MNNVIRPLCKKCNANPRAYAYKKNNKIYWRSKCESCIRQEKLNKLPGVPKWKQNGYTKKPRCELCGFIAADERQLDVFHIDGNKNNNSEYNLKTVCANCGRLKSVHTRGWEIGDLEADN